MSCKTGVSNLPCAPGRIQTEGLLVARSSLGQEVTVLAAPALTLNMQQWLQLLARAPCRSCCCCAPCAVKAAPVPVPAWGQAWAWGLAVKGAGLWQWWQVKWQEGDWGCVSPNSQSCHQLPRTLDLVASHATWHAPQLLVDYQDVQPLDRVASWAGAEYSEIPIIMFPLLALTFCNAMKIKGLYKCLAVS